MIEVERLTKRYFRSRALDDIPLQVEAGRVVGVLGENGSGKSTLFKILAGVTRPSSGAARVMGQPVGLATRRCTSYLADQ
jgi:ABC-2 type transport system ATP-binding protein